MPELPEVEAVCRLLRRQVIGAAIVAATVQRPGVTHPQPRRRLETRVAGARLTAVDRRGKNILLRLDTGDTLRAHLRMTGNLYVIPDVRFRPATARAWFELEAGRGLIFDDPRALGKIHIHRTARIGDLEDEVGLEPLSEAFTREALAAMAARCRKPAKLFLVDQRRIAGLGNIYAAEALFRAGIHPGKPVHQLRPARLAALHQAIREVLETAVASAAEAYRSPRRYASQEWFPCLVYDREGEPCARCQKPIRRIRQGGRSTYFCPGCQRR